MVRVALWLDALGHMVLYLMTGKRRPNTKQRRRLGNLHRALSGGRTSLSFAVATGAAPPAIISATHILFRKV